MYGLVYMNLLSKPNVYYATWISKLPGCMTMTGECGASILMDVIIQLFCSIFLNAVKTLCEHICSCGSASHATSMENKEDDEEWHIGEVQHFFGWAIKESIDYWKDMVNKELLVNDDEMTTQMNRCLTIVRSMHCFHNEILFDDEYVKNTTQL